MQDRVAVCSCCREKKPNASFYPTFGVQANNNKTLGICKDCCEAKLTKYRAILGDEAGAWALMGELGLPFIRAQWKNAQEVAEKTRSVKGADALYTYIKLLKECGTIYQGFWDSDTTLEELRKKRSETRGKTDYLDLDLMHKRWGELGNLGDYIFLEDTYKDYTNDMIDVDSNTEKRYRDLCIAELQKRRAQESGDTAETAKAQKNVNELLKLLKLDDFKSNQKDEEEKFIERMCWRIENTKPAECEELDKYRDVAGFEKTWEHIMRSVRNLIAGTKDYPDIPKEEL